MLQRFDAFVVQIGHLPNTLYPGTSQLERETKWILAAYSPRTHYGVLFSRSNMTNSINIDKKQFLIHQIYSLNISSATFSYFHRNSKGFRENRDGREGERGLFLWDVLLEKETNFSWQGFCLFQINYLHVRLDEINDIDGKGRAVKSLWDTEWL